jgi:D-serine deaminase-like pyridoxal phosphate-dependent protein
MHEQLATPCLIIHAEAVQRNIARLAEYAMQYDLDVRPHTKTHKLVRVGEMQMDAGATGLTVAKAGEAEVMAKATDDLLVAYPALDRARADRLGKLARHKPVRVAVDSAQAAKALAAAARASASTLGILVDLDVGMHRTGLQSPDAVLALAQLIDREAGIRFDGVFCFPGHIWGTPGEQEQALQDVSQMLGVAVDLLDSHGLEAPIISGGSTPTAFQSHLITDLTEIRPGTYVYYDANCFIGGYCQLEDCAARVLVTVVSDAVPNQVVIDAGSKTFSSDRCHPDPERGFGYVVEYPDARITRLTEEHGQVDVSKCDPRPKLGERLTVVPNHICPCVNLQDSVWWMEGGVLEPVAVDARGKLS